MRIAFLAATAATALLAQPAQSEVYVGLSGGAVDQQRSDDRGAFTATVPATPDYPAIPSGTPLTLETLYDTGFNISGTVGYRFDNGIRVEGEIFYSKNNIEGHRNLAAGGTVIDGVDVSVLTRTAPAPGNPTVGAVIADGADGRIENLGAFANVYFDFNRNGAFQPYVGGGIGAARVDVRYAPSDVPVAAGEQTKFAYQLIAGATWRASPRVELFGQFAYRATDRIDIPLQIVPARWDVENRQSVFSAGIRIPFGGDRG